jgi:hypothetical protein
VEFPTAGVAPAIFLPSKIFDLWLGASLGFWISVRAPSPVRSARTCQNPSLPLLGAGVSWSRTALISSA